MPVTALETRTANKSRDPTVSRRVLVVVGSRGLHGLAALGSVSERVAHSAACSTLVVREPAWQRIAAELGR